MTADFNPQPNGQHMYAILSPAKSLDFTCFEPIPPTTPEMLDDTAELIGLLKGHSVDDIRQLMGLSEKLSQLNHERFQSFAIKPAADVTKSAILAFKGDVYEGMQAGSFSNEELTYAQSHVGILSGLYGLLRPLDLIQAYRLEMGTRLRNNRGKNLYEFWADKINQAIADRMAAAKDETLVNLASNEYNKAARLRKLDCRVITPAFKDVRNGKLQMISFFAKKARGMMAAYMVKQEVRDVDALLRFNTSGYEYREDLSSADAPVFVRDET